MSLDNGHITGPPTPEEAAEQYLEETDLELSPDTVAAYVVPEDVSGSRITGFDLYLEPADGGTFDTVEAPGSVDMVRETRNGELEYTHDVEKGGLTLTYRVTLSADSDSL